MDKMSLSQQASVVSSEMSLSSLPRSGRVLTAAYLKNSPTEKELIRRLRRIVETLQEDETVDPDSPDFPGLSSLTSALVEDFFDHRNKDVRLYTVMACVGLLSKYVPDMPWSDTEMLRLFEQTIRQLANLQHTTNRSQENYKNYYYILDTFASCKIANCLVHIAETGIVPHADDSDDDSGADSESKNQQLDTPSEILTDLFRTLLTLLRPQHHREVSEKIAFILDACLKDYGAGRSPPLAIVEEILKVVGDGPVTTLSMPPPEGAKDKRPREVKVPSRPFAVAKDVILKNTDRLSTPVSMLLNGIVNGEPHIVENSSITAEYGVGKIEKTSCDVWTIILHLHMITPDILTTVIGTVSSRLEVQNETKRRRIVKLLGELFDTEGSDCATSFRACYHLWLRRLHDASKPIRRDMVSSLCKILKTSHDNDVIEEAEATLQRIIDLEPDIEIRLQAIEDICNEVYSGTNVSPKLMQAIGARVKSKFRKERIACLGGLANIFLARFMKPRVAEIDDAGDAPNVGMIQEVLHSNCRFLSTSGQKTKGRRRSRADREEQLNLDAERYAWIPGRIFEAACFSDAEDTDCRSICIKIVDHFLVGSRIMRGKTSTSQARAVGLVMILDHMRNDGAEVLGENMSNAYKFMVKLFHERTKLQNAVSSYLIARSNTRGCEKGSEEAAVAHKEAMMALKRVAQLTAPPPDGRIEDILEKLHGARDKQVFRLLASIASATHSSFSIKKALDELPKRTESLGGGVSAWIKGLVRRCAMGGVLSVDAMVQCTLLARECFAQEDIASCAGFLSCVKMAVEVSPSLCSTKGTLTTLIELFLECRSIGPKKRLKSETDAFGLVTALSAILSSMSQAKGGKLEGRELDYALQKQLMQLCTRDGTPQQARHAVQTMATLLIPCKDSSPMDREEEYEAFYPLLKELTAPSRMTITSSKDRRSPQIVSVLTSLAALAECAPRVLLGNPKGENALQFALETVLLGRSHCEDDEGENGGSSDEGEESGDEGAARTSGKKTPTRRSTSSRALLRHMSPGGGPCLLEDTELDVSCRTACAAIEFIVSYIRSIVLLSKSRASVGSIELPPANRIRKVFELLAQIIEDQGLPPSNRDRKTCKTRQDRAALRQCAAVHLLRLCDSQLRLERDYLTFREWEILSTVFLDEERAVRDAVMEELESMLKGVGHYKGARKAEAPNLRFVALVTLCCDGDHGGGHSRGNGNAANVGRRAVATKAAATGCVKSLRLACNALSNQLRAILPPAEADKQMELHKVKLMPEYIVPFAFHLLSFRPETPSEGSATVATRTGRTQTQDEAGEAPASALDESQQRCLKKRLRWLFEPLVASLGESANNVSFLLEFLSLLGKKYVPISLSAPPAGLLALDSSPASPVADNAPVRDLEPVLVEARLKAVCSAAREVLLSFVRKDYNLTDYPGKIRIPSLLFSSKQAVGVPSGLSPSLATAKMTPTLSGNREASSASSARRSRVTFSPDLVRAPGGDFTSPAEDPFTAQENEFGGGLSPIRKAGSPGDSEAPTLSSNAPTGLTNEESPSVKPGLSVDVEALFDIGDKEAPSPLFQSSPTSAFSKVLKKRRKNKRTKAASKKQKTSEGLTPANANTSEDLCENMQSITQSTTEAVASPASGTKAKRRRSASKSTVPTHIKLSSRKEPGRSSKKQKPDDFSFAATSESDSPAVTPLGNHQENRKGRRSTRASKSPAW